jgi:hypothetical protein
LSTVASSSAIQTAVNDRSRVGMKNSSWCHAWPGLPSALMNSIDCIALTFGPITPVKAATIRS